MSTTNVIRVGDTVETTNAWGATLTGTVLAINPVEDTVTVRLDVNPPYAADGDEADIPVDVLRTVATDNADDDAHVDFD